VDQSAHRVRRDHAKQPQHNQYHYYRHQHSQVLLEKCASQNGAWQRDVRPFNTRQDSAVPSVKRVNPFVLYPVAALATMFAGMIRQEPSRPHRQPLDAQDMARALMTFRGQPIQQTPTLRQPRPPVVADTSAYVFDEESGMAYIVE
jgi:hypothetical protein